MTIDHGLKEEADNYVDTKVASDPKHALTHVRCLHEFEIPLQVDQYATTRLSLMQCEPITGRKHQIRRHLKHIGHPIVGDSRHCKGLLNRACEHYFGAGRLWLACTQVIVTGRQGQPLVIKPL